MRSTGPVLALVLMLATVPTPAVPSATATRTGELAREVTAFLEKGDLDAVAARFSPQMAAALPAAKFREFWSSLPAQLGALKSLGTPVVRTEGDVENAWVPATFEIAVVSLRMYFDAEGRLAGLRIMPGPPPGDWSPAPYADPARVREREVTVGSGAWALPGTLTLPAKRKGLLPALVLVHGSGPHDRDETVGGTKVFRDLAGGLAARGVVVLRYEKRTKVHATRMKDLPVTVKEEVVDDALAAIALLRAQPEVDAKRVAVLGHSLGGMLAPRIAAGDPALAGLVILAGNTRPLDVLASEQVAYLVSVGSVTKEQAHALNAEMAKVRAIDPAKLPATGTLFLGAPAEYWLELAAYDPAATVKKLGIPVLVLQGGRDYQVTIRDFDGWKTALDGSPLASLHVFPKLNHLLVEGEGPSTPAEYEPPGHVSEDVVKTISDWAQALRGRPGP